jgi:hypothetical protein
MTRCGGVAVVSHVAQAGLALGGLVVLLGETVLVRVRFPLCSTVIDSLGQIQVLHDHSLRP